MSELHEQVSEGQKPASDFTAQIADASKRGLELSLGAQKAVLDEIIEAGSSALEHSQAQMNVAAEFASKVAEAHSFKDIVKACRECSQHQMDIVRQDSQRFVAHVPGNSRSVVQAAGHCSEPEERRPKDVLKAAGGRFAPD